VTAAEEASVRAGDLARDVLVVPETTAINELLLQFRDERQQVAAVIDEWGAFEGLVTVEDAVEAIVGDLRDDFDTERAPAIRAREDGGYDVDGGVSLAAINETLDVAFESESYETIGGVVLDELGQAPEMGETVELAGYVFEVTAVEGNRIDSLRVAEDGDGADSPTDRGA
jgi:CBS domain containing-hemolysin-like protein